MKNNQSFVLVRKVDIDKILANGPHQGKKFLEPLKSLAESQGLLANIVEITASPVSESNAEIHKEANDLFICLDGEIGFICGGKLVNPWAKDENELRAKEISGGTELVLKSGDWLWIPAGMPHKNFADFARLIVIKVPFSSGGK